MLLPWDPQSCVVNLLKLGVIYNNNSTNVIVTKIKEIDRNYILCIWITAIVLKQKIYYRNIRQLK